MKRLLNGAAMLTVLTALVIMSGCPNTVESSSVAVTGVTLDKTTLTLTEGESGKLTATISPVNATNKAATWSSNNSEVASVDANGTVRAHKAGQALITVKTQDSNKTAMCTVTVTQKAVSVTGVTLDKTALTLTEGESGKLITTITPANATNKAVTWSSNNDEVASVDANGTVMAHKVGQSVITVKTQDGNKTAMCTVTVTQKAVSVTDVSLDKTALTLTEGESGKLTATISPVNATNKAVTWNSNNGEVASVDANGTVMAHKVGQSVITVKTQDGNKTASCTVTVVLPQYKIDFSTAGGTGNLTARLDGNIIDTGAMVEKGRTVIFIAEPSSGYKSVWEGVSAKAGTPNEAELTVTQTASIKVTFVPEGDYSITYNLNGGTNHTDNPASYTVETATITLQDASKIGYTFAGWYDNAECTGEKVTQIIKGSTGNKELWAKWEAVSYSITYNLNGGTNHTDNPASYTVETETITLKDATKENYTFAGWYDNAGFTGEKVTKIVKGSSGNKELWAKFLESYSITYNLNGGTNHTDNPASYTVETETITLKDATKENYTFAGWYDNAECTGAKKTKIEKGSTGDKAFWAKWEQNTYLVSFNVKDGYGSTLKVNGQPATTPGAIVVSHGDTVTFTAEPAQNHRIGKWKIFTGTSNTPQVSFGDITKTITVTAPLTVRVFFFHESAGTIVLKDGTRVLKDSFTSIDPSNPPVAVLIGMKNAQGKSLGVGLHRENRLCWARKGSTGESTLFEKIICKPSLTYAWDYEDAVTFSGDKDGSNNWEYICSIDPEGTANAAANYPAFHWVNEYGTKYNTGSQKWYMPSIAELHAVYKTKEAIYASLKKIHSLNSAYADWWTGTDPYYTNTYWSSSQHEDLPWNAFQIIFSPNMAYIDYYNKGDTFMIGNKMVWCMAAF